MASLSSFIGVDGTNTTPNSGRLQINLKPRDERAADASAIIRRLQPELEQGRGHHALPAAGAGPDDRGPGQPHAVPVHARGRRRRRARRVGAAARGAAARRSPSSRDVASDQQSRGLQASLVIDRDTASRLGVLPQAIDDTLYDAFGQRQVSTIFTQLNQYRVILEVAPRFQQDPDALKSIYVHVERAARRCRSPRSRGSSRRPRRSPSTTRASSPRSRSRSTWRPASRWARRSTPSAAVERDIGLPRPHPAPASRAPPRPSRPRWRTSRC